MQYRFAVTFGTLSTYYKSGLWSTNILTEIAFKEILCTKDPLKCKQGKLGMGRIRKKITESDVCRILGINLKNYYPDDPDFLDTGYPVKH